MSAFFRDRSRRWRALPVLAFILSAGTTGAQPNYQVIVHGNTPGVQIKRDMVRAIFLGELTRWTDGTPVRAVDQSLRSPIRASFCEGALGQTPSALNAYWTQRVMTGRVTPPPVKSGDDEVVTFVRNNPGAIGYVAAGASAPDGVKILKIVD
jgi:ABC-type phosphate transport system substrate-binding protein